MPIIIRQARTSQDLDDILKIRGQYIDHLDIFPETIHLYALKAGSFRGAIRATRYRPHEQTMNSVYNFQQAYAGLNSSAAIIDLLTLEPDYRRMDLIAIGLLKGIFFSLQQKMISSAFFCCPLELTTLATQLGFVAISSAFFSNEINAEVTPMVFDLNNHKEKSFAAVLDKEILQFREIFNLAIFEAGETLVLQGDRGRNSYLIEEGQVDVVLNRNENLVSVAELSTGQLIGELAMMTREARTASIIAKTTVTCFSIDRADFLKFIYQQPHYVLDLFKICSKRLESANQRIAQTGAR